MSIQRSSLDEGKNNSRTAETSQNEQSTLGEHIDQGSSVETPDRYDCRNVYRNMEMESESGETAPFRCNSWDCYRCAHRMRCNLIEELDRLVEERPELRRLATVTIDSSKVPNYKTEHKWLTERFNALRTELKDRYPGLSYIWIREEGDSDNPHLHLLLDRYVPQADLSRLSGRVGLGEITDIRRVNARNAAKYVTKYLSKGAFHDLPDGARRYGSSADISLDVRGSSSDEDSDEWRLMMDDYEIQPQCGNGPLRREVTGVDLWRQKIHGGPLGIPPPD